MKENEIEILKNYLFVKRLANYTHEAVSERICEAWLDTSKATWDDEEFTEDFVDICENIMRATQ